MNRQQTLEAVGIPISLAKEAAVILEKEAENPFYQRTKEEQELINHSHIWWVAQGMKSVGDNNGHSQA
jgi:hypothetical protein